MTKKVSVHGFEEFYKILEEVKVSATFETTSSTIVIGHHEIFGSIVGVSNIEECFIISG